MLSELGHAFDRTIYSSDAKFVTKHADFVSSQSGVCAEMQTGKPWSEQVCSGWLDILLELVALV